jgi:hypothetical protein
VILSAAEWSPILTAFNAELGSVCTEDLSSQPATLSHYTSIGTLEHILSSRCFLAGDAVTAKDQDERGFSRTLFKSILGHAEQDLAPHVDSMSRHLFDLARQFFADDELQPRHFFASFSGADDEITSQWRDYGDHYRGIMITIDTIAAHRTNDVATMPALRRVIYGDADGEQLSIILRAVKIGQGLALPSHLRIGDAILDTAAAILAFHYVSQSLVFKLKKWSSEREWRFIRTMYRSDTLADVRTINGRDYLPIPLGVGDRLPITRVTAGARCSDDDVDRIRRAVAQHGYDGVPVVRSNVHP